MKEKYYLHLNMESNINQALQNEEFQLYYQPIIDLKTQKITALEALIRWWNKDGQFIPPNEFIPFARKSGQIFSIGQWVLEEGCRQQNLWESQELSVATEINFSARQFEREDLPDIVRREIINYGLEPHDIRIEITESSLIKDLSKCAGILKVLSNMGIKIILDDFGTGYSSLSYLMNLPLDILKLDRSFITEIDKDENKQEVAENLINLAHCLEIDVTAEGVENEDELNFLVGVDCDYAQGYYFARPQPPEDLFSLLNR